MVGTGCGATTSVMMNKSADCDVEVYWSAQEVVLVVQVGEES